MRGARAWGLAVLIVLCLAAPSWALTVSGKVVGPAGHPVAGAFISDGERIVATGPDGGFKLDTRPGLVVALTAPPALRPAGRWWWPAARAAKLGALRLKAAPRMPKERMRLAVLSDPHLYVANLEPAWAKDRIDPRLPLRAWQQALTHLRGFGPDLTLMPGDLAMQADKGGPGQARAYLELAAASAAMAPTPWRATPGNHDVRYVNGKVDLGPWREFMGPARGVFRLGPVAVILLDNVGAAKGHDNKIHGCGRTSPEALAWLKSLLALLPMDTPLLIASHYPLLSPLAGVNPLYPRSLVAVPGARLPALKDVDQSAIALLGMLQGRPLVGLISGHQHAWFNEVLFTSPQPLHHVGAPAICGRWWQGDMRYGPARFKPGFLTGWLEKSRIGWRMRLQMVGITLPPIKP